MKDLLPQIWDFYTIMWVVGIVLFFFTWLAVAFYFAPVIFKRFDKATSGYVDWMVHMFDRMFKTVDRRICTVSIVLSMSLFGVLGWWITSALPMKPGYHVIRGIIMSLLIFGPFGIPVGFRLPRKIVDILWTRRVRKFENQMLDALSFMSNGLRSGLSLVQCMEMVVEELDNPISEEFALVMSEQRVGVPFEEALLNLEKRMDSEDLQIMVTSINILRTSGGNLTETFETISYTIRERKKVEGRIRSLTAQGLAQAVVITIMPFALGFILWTMDHELVARMWSTWLGWVLIGVMLILQTIGGLMMRRIVRIRV